MTSIRKKLFLLLFTLFAAVSLGLGLMFLPDKAYAITDISDAKYFKIDANGVFSGLTEDAYTAIGQTDFTITLPASVKAIGDGNENTGATPTRNLLFSNDKYNIANHLVGVKFAAPENLESIGYRAFVNCSSLKNMDLSGMTALSNLGDGIFRECASLTEVTLPASVTAVPNFMFRGCIGLTSVSFEGEVVSIGMSAFANCGKLSFSLPATLETLGSSAFIDCSSLKTVVIPDTVTTIGESVFANCVNLTSVTLPKNIAAIPASMFSNCSKLTGFDIPSTVKNIGANALSNCISLTQITVPSGVTDIGLNAFSGLDGIETINYYAANATAEGAPFAMSDYSRSKGVVVNIGDTTQPSITRLPQKLFFGHKAVTKALFKNVKMPNGVQDFGANLFSGCTALTEVGFGDACIITVINNSAFEGCTSLHTVTGIENIKLQTIGEKAFYNCRSLNTIVIGPQVTHIADTDKAKAFTGCERLIEVKNLSALDIKAGEMTFGDVARYAKHVYKEGASRIDTNLDGYVFYANIDGASSEVLLLGYKGTSLNLVLPQSYQKDSKAYAYNIYKSAFKGNTSIETLTVPESSTFVKKIDDSAFEGCTALTSVDLPKGLEEVGVNLFQGCTSLVSVDFNNNDRLSTLNDYMFSGCKSLRIIDIPSKIVHINSYAFGGCTELRTVTFSSKNPALQAIRGHAFDGCTSLTAIDLPATVTTMGAGSFENCTNLGFVYLPDDATYSENVFKNCSDNLILISVDKARYNEDKAKPNLQAFVDKGQLTYIVPLTLIYNDDCVDGKHTVNKLYKKSGDFSQNMTTLSWSATGRLPIQGGHDNSQLYVESVWYEDAAYKTKVEVDDLTAKLAADDVEEIVLYARYFSHPELSVPNSMDFEVGREYTIKEILVLMFREGGKAITEARAEELISTFSFTITDHMLVNGDNDDGWYWETGKKLGDAGTYTLKVSLPTDGSYGGWASDKLVEFTINAGEVDITDLLVWKTLAPENNETKTLYFYNGNHTPYLEELEGQTPTETATKSNSYTVFTGSEISIRLEWIDELHRYGDIGSYTGNIQTEAGTYEATAVLTPFNNYIFTYGTDTATLAKLDTFNLKFDTAKDGTVIVTKKWYIAISDVNQLLSADGHGLFDIPTELNYNDKDSEGAHIPLRPTLSKIPLQAPKLLTFTLSFTDMDGTKIDFNDGNKIAIENYEKYFNSAMPAGEYTAKFFIEAGTDENGNLVTGDPQGKAYVFTVKECGITKSDVTQVKSMLANTDVPYTDGGLHFAGSDAIAYLNRVYTQASVHTGFIWNDYKQYYAPFEIKYRVVRVGEENSDDNYYTKEEYENGAGSVKPQAIGSYVIYYVIEAPNFSGEISGSYKLNITHTLSPVLPAFDYDGTNVLNNVLRSLEITVGLEYFDIYTMLDYSKLSPTDSLKRETISAPDALRTKNSSPWGKIDSYTEIGKHLIFLKIKEGYASYIKWNAPTDGGYLYLTVSIIASANSLSVNEWEFGRFNPEVNAPVFKVSYGKDTQYAFLLKSKDGEGKEYKYYTNPNLQIPEGCTFNDAPVGEYLMSAHAKVGDEVMFEIFDFELTVHKVKINFEKTPYLSGWTYGQITKDTDFAGQIKSSVKLGAGIGAHVMDEIVLKYITASNYEAGKNPVSDVSSLMKDGMLPSGDYYVILTRPEGPAYEELNYAIKFSVLKAPNFWLTEPVDKELKNISVDGLFDLFKAGYGTAENVKIELKAKDSDQWRNVKSEDFPYKTVAGQIRDGEYEMRITIVSGDLCELSETVNLKVDSKMVTPPDGDNSVVSDDGVSDGAVIAVIIVMAVIAAAIIGGGVALVLIKNKKANDEYLKTVKSEMKRR